MQFEARLKNMEKLRKEAMKDPDNNKLYIEDLNLSIAHFKEVVNKKVEIGSGFAVDSEEQGV